MATQPTVDQSDIDKLEQGMKDLTSLGQQLLKTYKDIGKETDVLGNGFRTLISKAQQNNDLASRYLISQKLQEATQNRINEIKSKSSFLDQIGLDAKREETQLQMRIAAAQIRALQSNIAIAGINNEERLRAIESLKIQNVLRGAELRYMSTTANNQSQVIERLNQQLNTIQAFTPILRTNNAFVREMKNIFGDTLSSMGDFGKILSGTIPTYKDIIEKGVKMFFEFDKASFTLRKSFGFLRRDFDVLEKNIKEIAIDLADLGVTFESAATATSAIGKEFNALVASNKSVVKDVTILSAQLGIAEAESAKFLKSISSISGNTVVSQKGMTGFAKQMANAAGVPLSEIMKDISEDSDDVRIYTGKSVVNLIKGTVEARQMGTTFKNMTDTAKKLLEFTNSINDEMEASVLLGKDINFQRARELSFRKDVIGANREILRIAQSMDFDAMDPFQAESFAKASGKTVVELQNMIQAEKEIQYIRQFGTNEQKKQLSLMNELKQKREAEAKDIGKQAEVRLMQEANQERLNQLQNQFNKLMMELAKPVMDFVGPLFEVATLILPPILQLIKLITLSTTGLFMSWLFLIKPINAFVKSLIYGQSIMKSFGSFGTSFGRSFSSFFQLIKGTGKFFGLISRFGGLVGTISKFLGPIGLIINAFMFINNLIKRFNEFVGTDGLLLGGLKAIGYAIYDTLIQPFVDAFNWIKEKSGFMANSPSVIGLGILDGIKSIGAALLDAITAPFRTGFNFISGYFGGPKLPSLTEMIGATPVTNTEPIKNQTESSVAIIDGNRHIVDKLDELITLMRSGGIAVNVDGSKVSTAIGVATKFRGSYGSF